MGLTYLLSVQCTRNCPFDCRVFPIEWRNFATSGIVGVFSSGFPIFALRREIAHGFAFLYVSSVPGKGYCPTAASPINNLLLFFFCDPAFVNVMYYLLLTIS